MKNIFCRPLSILTILILLILTCFTLAGCNNSNSATNSTATQSSSKENAVTSKTYPTQIYDKDGNPVDMPTDNDEEGWFSVEVLNQYSVPAFSLPEGTKVTSKPQRDSLYLKGDENTLQLSALYAYDSIRATNDAVYLPVYTISENEVAEISFLEKIGVYDGNNLYPQGDETSVTFIYKSAHKIYQCSITLENTTDGSEQVCISFSEKTDEYKAFV